VLCKRKHPPTTAQTSRHRLRRINHSRRCTRFRNRRHGNASELSSAGMCPFGDGYYGGISKASS
ncbi:hypothetical protein QTG54_011797, partial [Skeletonema marinoi]